MSLSQLILWTKKTLALRKKMKVSIKDVFSNVTKSALEKSLTETSFLWSVAYI